MEWAIDYAGTIKHPLIFIKEIDCVTVYFGKVKIIAKQSLIWSVISNVVQDRSDPDC